MLTKVSYYWLALLPSPVLDRRPARRELSSALRRRSASVDVVLRLSQPGIPDAANIPPDFDADKWDPHAVQRRLMMYFFFRDHASQGRFPPSAASARAVSARLWKRHLPC